jgi:DNA invertase Pin-like site-specific DNA recombinase
VCTRADLLRLMRAKVRAMKAKGIGDTEIAKALKIGRASVYRALEGA